MKGGCLAAYANKKGQSREIGRLITGESRSTIYFEKNDWVPSRLSYHLNVNIIPRRPPNQNEGLVLHTCDRGWCIEPDHLYLGNRSQNAIDAWDRHPTWQARMMGKQNALGHKCSDEARMKMSKARTKWWKEKQNDSSSI